MNRRANPLVGATATEIAAHRRVDLLVGRRRGAREQRGGAHDLPCLAIPALWNVFRDPRALHGMCAFAGQSFDRRDATARRGGEWRHTRTCRNAVEVHRARAALSDATSKLRSGEAE